MSWNDRHDLKPVPGTAVYRCACGLEERPAVRREDGIDVEYVEYSNPGGWPRHISSSCPASREAK